MSKITYTNKVVGDLMTANMANEIKASVNNLYTAYINYFDFSSASVTTIAQTNTWYKLNTSTTEGFSNNGLVHSNNRVTWTGEDERVFKLEGIVSVESGNNNQVHVAFFKNGALHPCSEQEVTTSGSGRASNIAFHCLIELDTNDFIEVYTKNATSTTSITLDNVNVIVEQKPF
jgi:hypothetical protein